MTGHKHSPGGSFLPASPGWALAALPFRRLFLLWNKSLTPQLWRQNLAHTVLVTDSSAAGGGEAGQGSSNRGAPACSPACLQAAAAGEGARGKPGRGVARSERAGAREKSVRVWPAALGSHVVTRGLQQGAMSLFGKLLQEISLVNPSDSVRTISVIIGQ